MQNKVIILCGKLISTVSKISNFGHGSTWPGHIALMINSKFINQTLEKSKAQIILVTGTNGKTTTAKLLQTIFEVNEKKVILNSSGANLLNGIASSLIINSDLSGKLNSDFAIFEIDENTLPQITKIIEPDFIIALNLFRDQLDRYGEIDTIARKWKEAYAKLSRTQFVLNADDPQIAYLGGGLKNMHYFGLNSKGNDVVEHAADSILCPKCGKRLIFSTHYFSHLGDWKCQSCGLTRPARESNEELTYPLIGTYAIYDIQAAALLAKLTGLTNAQINLGLKKFQPAFGRQEILKIRDKNVQLFLSKNPTSFNESLRTITEKNADNLLIVLNDRIPDGTDVSWIWDIDFETLIKSGTKLYLAGDRVYDLALRIKYAGIRIADENIFEDLREAIERRIYDTKNQETCYILPTYSAMLEARKILTGKKIL
ncbi:MAG: MurT ligase domain-containing protein [Candidatus Levyibacteriota bacterium]|jgi:UDP-N-acetylmuramyl tripeptide synthase